MQTTLLQGQLEQTIQTQYGDGNSCQVENAFERRRHSWRPSQVGHWSDSRHTFEWESRKLAGQVEY
jgi:hypothetical protein